MIKTKFDPTIKLRTMAAPEIKPKDDKGQSSGTNKQSRATATGNLAPEIEIGSHRVFGADLIECEIDQTGFLPTLRLSFTDSTGAYQGQYHPDDTPLVKVYIKSQTAVLKPYRADFLITSSVGTPQPTTEFTGPRTIIYTIHAELFVDGIYGQSVSAISKKSSFDALQEIAKKLKLGFATNEESTSDIMTWINPNTRTVDWIDSITKRAYKDDDSFFISFIDIHYYLNFINIEKALGNKTEVYQMPADLVAAPDKNIQNANAEKTKDNDKDYSTTVINLTNSQKAVGNNHYLIFHKKESRHGEVLAQNNFRKNMVIHNRKHYLDNKEMLSFFVEPNTKKANPEDKNNVYQKPKLETFEKEATTKWLGVDYSNSHKDYKWAKLLNMHNRSELKKNWLNATVASFGNFLIKGSKVAVTIMKPSSENPANTATDPNFPNFKSAPADARKEAVDLYLTGAYYVSGIKFKYDAMAADPILKWNTDLVLARREWIPINKDSKPPSEVIAETK